MRNQTNSKNKSGAFDCRSCVAFPDHNPRKGTCALGHDFIHISRMHFSQKANGKCVTKCHTQEQQTHYLIELGKNPEHVPRKPRKLRGV